MFTDFYLTALAFFLPFAGLWTYLRKKGLSYEKGENFSDIEALPITLGLQDHLKALFCWIFNFMKTFRIKPGLYSIGEVRDNTPLLVTCNYFLTLFLLSRRIAKRDVRLLVIDTDGINVWCSAGKGKFSAGAILDAMGKAGLLGNGRKPQVILPKFCLSGVSLEELKQGGAKPIIGPLYAKDLPEFLDQDKPKGCIADTVSFGLQSRLFTALPTSVQFLYYSLLLYLLGLGHIPFAIVPATALLAFLYPTLFPWLPGKLFTTKGLSLSLFVIAGIFLLSLPIKALILWALFLLATQLYISLSYTGNSAVSNYTGVRKETARFLPIIAILYLLILPAYFLL